MRSLGLPLGLLLGLGLATQVCIAAGLLEEDGGQAPRMFPVQSPYAADLKRLRAEIGKHTASKRMTLRFYSQLDDLENRLNPLPVQPTWPHPSIDPGIIIWADPSIDPGIISWADPSIDPGIALMRPVSPEEFRKLADARGWPRPEINGQAYYIMPLAETPEPTAPQAVVVPAWK